MSTMPLVSVIIPCYNQGHFLGEAIRSTLDQTYPRIEIVVVDDGSDDRTPEVARSYSGVRYIRQDNQGLSAARNAGFAFSRGEYVVFLDSDDRLHPEAVATNLAILDRERDAALCFGRTVCFHPDGRTYPVATRVGAEPYLDLLRRNLIICPGSAMYRRRVLDSVGGFDPSLNPAADYDMYLRIAGPIASSAMTRSSSCIGSTGRAWAKTPRSCCSSVLRVLRSQRDHVRDRERFESAYREGLEYYRRFYGERLYWRAVERFRAGQWSGCLKDVGSLARLGPEVLLRELTASLCRVAVHVGPARAARTAVTIPRPRRGGVLPRLLFSGTGGRPSSLLTKDKRLTYIRQENRC